MGAGLQRASDAAKRSRHPGTPAPAINQRWRDNDTRSGIVREVVIVELREEGLKVRCDIYNGGVKAPKQTTIACKRLVPTSTGYTYVGEGPPAQMPGSRGSK